jgi:hypothetical protein
MFQPIILSVLWAPVLAAFGVPPTETYFGSYLTEGWAILAVGILNPAILYAVLLLTSRRPTTDDAMG